jgi:hypothetical protein
MKSMSFTLRKITIIWSPDNDTHIKLQQLFDLLGLEDEIFEDDEGDQPEQERAGAGQQPLSPVKMA